MSSVKLTPKSSSKQQPPKFVVGTKSINEIPGPVLATFGDFPALESIDPTGEDPLLFDAYTIEAKKLVTKNAPANDNNIFNQQYILKGETSVIEYHASTHNSKRANQSKYIIGIFDPSKNEVELVPVPGLFMMEQAAKNVKLFFETPEEDVRKRSARALQVFGATGAKNLSKRMTLDSLHDGTGNVTEGMVEDLKNHLAENPDNLREGPKIEYFSDLPSPDTTTREVTEVYDPLKIIPESIWPGIPRIFAKTSPTKLTEKYHLRPVLLKILKHPYIAKRAHLSTKILKERLIIYAALLGTLRADPKLAVASFGRSHIISRGLSEFILSTFAIPERGVDVYTCNRETYYRAANYAAVAMLIAFDLSLDNETVEDFATLVDLSPEEVKVVFDRVGCTITKTGVKLVQPWKVWENASKQNAPILERYLKARKRSLERIKANQQKEKEEAEAQQAEDDGVDPNAMNLEDEEEPVKEESVLDDDDNDFVSGVKGGSEKKRSRKSIGEKPKEDPLNKKKKM